MNVILSSIRRLAGIDSAVLFTLLNKGFSAIASLATIAALALFLTMEEQGYYYTFASLFNLQVFFELGFTFVLTQFVAHEFAKSNADEISREQKELARQRLSSLILLSKRWFNVVAILFWISVTVGGYLFFCSHQKTNSMINWQLPWVTAVTCFSASILLLPINATLEGCQKIKEVAKIRTLQDVIAFSCFWISLFAGAGLLSIGVLYLIRTLTNLILLRRAGLLQFLESCSEHDPQGQIISWKKEIFPFQWRISLSWLSGYLIFSLFTPVLFAYHGPRVAGQMGMTLAIFTGITNLSMAWVVTQAPYFSQSVALNKYVELNRNFDKVFFKSTLVNIALVTVGVLCIYIISCTPYSHKTLHGIPVIFIAMTSVGNHVVFAMATYLRSFKEELLLNLSILMGLLTGASTFALGRHYSAAGVAFGYMFTTTFISVPYAYYIFANKRSALAKLDV